MEVAGLECAEANADVSEGLRASAGISTGAAVRHLCTAVTAGGKYICFAATVLVCTWPIGVSTEVPGTELDVTGKAPSGRIKCKLLPTLITAVPKGM